MTTTPQGQQLRISRRQIVMLLAGTGITALLAACGTNGTTSSATASTGSSTTGSAASGTGGSMSTTTGVSSASMAATPTGGSTAGTAPIAIQIPPSGAKLPSGNATIRWLVLGPGPRSPYYQALFKAYEQEHPNIQVKLQQLDASQLRQVLTLGMQNGDAPDVFQLPGGITGGQIVSAGWVAPLDDVIPDFQVWQKSFPPGVFLPGITMFNGKTYTFPLGSNKRYDSLIFYNQADLQKAGYDPTAKPFTWDQFRAAAKKLTQQGAGRSFGLILGGGNQGAAFGGVVSHMAEMAGAAGGDLNWRNGEYNYTSPPFLAATQWLLDLKADGSIFPGAISLTQRQADDRMPQGQAAMTMDGPWVVARWQESYAGFAYGVASQPIPNSGTPLPLGYAPGGANQHWLYAHSKVKPIAGDLFSYMASVPGQRVFQSIVKGSLESILPQVTAHANLGPHAAETIKLFDQQTRLDPDPRARNPDVGKVYLELRTITPDLGETLVGLFSGQLSDPKQALQALQARATGELNRAIKAAQAKGANVSLKDWVFPNWDPTKDYTEQDYQALTSS